MADFLGDRGHRVHTAENGDIALEMARGYRYDVGLLDLRMSGMDGLTLCRQLRLLWPNMEAIVITGHAHDGLDEDAHAAGAQRVLLKPVDVGSLLALVEQVLPATDREKVE
jgi:two-component system chemotaxis response regulator CheY